MSLRMDFEYFEMTGNSEKRGRMNSHWQDTLAEAGEMAPIPNLIYVFGTASNGPRVGNNKRQKRAEWKVVKQPRRKWG